MIFNSLTSLDVSGWDMSHVTDMSGMFGCCTSLTSLDLSTWSTAKVAGSVGSMFYNCPSLRSLTLGTQRTKSLASSLLPGTLYGADGNAYALADVPLGSKATHYTKAEYVPQADSAGQEVAEAIQPGTSATEGDGTNDTGSENGSPKGADSPAADSQDETPQAA